MSARGRRITIGLFVQSFGNEYSTGLVRALHASAQDRDVNLIAFVGGDYRSLHAYAEQRNMGFLLAHPRNVDGLLVLQIGTHVTPAELGRFIAHFAPLPACTIGVKCPGLPCVSLDNERAAKELMQHLVVQHQRRRILFISGPVENSEIQRRFQVYQDSLRSFDIPFQKELVLESEFASDEAREVVARHLEKAGLGFDAVMAATDTIAIGALAALHAAGVRVPDQVSVMGFDDIGEAWTTHPPLSTVRQPWRVQADAALDALLAQIAGDEALGTLLVSAELVPRRSCGCFESSIEHAGASIAVEPVRSLKEGFGRIEFEMGQLLGGARSSLRPGWSEWLATKLQSDLETGQRQFCTAIEDLSRDLVLANVPVRWFQEVISRMRSTILPQLESSGHMVQRAEDLLQQARIICADAAERQQLSRLIDADRVTQVLADATRALVTSFDLPALRRALAAELPRLGIRSAYLFLYEADGEPPIMSRLVFAYDQERSLDVEGPGQLQETTWLMQQHLLPQRRTSFALMPLYFEDSQLGVVLFEIGPDNGIIYEALRELLSAALTGARLRVELAQEAAQREKAERERLAKELEIATHLQTSILPKDLRVEGLEIAAAMQPATEVGGDYYEVLPIPGGAWLGIGDVAGHGLRPGLVMVMLQSIVAAVVAHSPDIAPKDMILVVNRVLYDNVRRRLGQDEHATLSVMRYEKSGRVVFAGAHEDIIVFKSRNQKAETIETPGTWVAGARDIEEVTVDSVLHLERGDLLLLYTDGVLEATNHAGEAFGSARLCCELERVADADVVHIREHLMTAVSDWVSEQRDDIALLVARQIA